MAAAPASSSGFSHFFGWGANASDVNTFKPLKQHKRRGQSRLHEHSYATLGAGNIRVAVKLPRGEDINEWLATNVIDFYNQISIMYGILSDFCTDETCPCMSAGTKYQYLWADNDRYRKPTRVSAPRYVDLLLEWIDTQFQDPSIFPVNEDQVFPEDFEVRVKKIFKRLFRIYAHIYHQHLEVFQELQCFEHLNSSFKHFAYFVLEFALINEKELQPLAHVINSIIQNDRSSR